MHRKASIKAAEIPARDQPISIETGCRNTLSDIIVPTPMQLTTMPTATMTQP
jgi:hypothetical protein